LQEIQEQQASSVDGEHKSFIAFPVSFQFAWGQYFSQRSEWHIAQNNRAAQFLREGRKNGFRVTVDQGWLTKNPMKNFPNGSFVNRDKPKGHSYGH